MHDEILGHINPPAENDYCKGISGSVWHEVAFLIPTLFILFSSLTCW